MSDRNEALSPKAKRSIHSLLRKSGHPEVADVWNTVQTKSQAEMVFEFYPKAFRDMVRFIESIPNIPEDLAEYAANIGAGIEEHYE